MPTQFDAYIDSISTFLAILFIQGIAFRKLREIKPNWFLHRKSQLLLSISIGVYYGLAGIYFIFRGDQDAATVVYTNMRMNILLITAIFGGRIPVTIAYSFMVIGHIWMGESTQNELKFILLLTGFYLICFIVTKLNMSYFKKYLIVFSCAIPVLAYYYFTDFGSHTILTGSEALLYYALFMLTSALVFAACNYIDKSNKIMFQLRNSAMTDMLTNLPNIRYFLETFEKAFLLSLKKKKPLSLIVIDIDNFKEINDVHGHQAGNTVLSQFSVILSNHVLPKSALISRIGGEEFSILLPNVALPESQQIAEIIRSQIERTSFPYNPKSGQVTISLGVSCQQFPDSNYKTKESLFEAADKALYLAKQSGRNQVLTSFSKEGLEDV
ncbi:MULTISPECIES: GGDEF domain-containing protein [Listeria]|uniref:GGDEF domain-containing protein n=1 Tax=Listeria TaxID=1637 RepID=UPI000B592EAA|nr:MULTISPECIES: GGDEF domain-containing protein [Listeria]